MHNTKAHHLIALFILCLSFTAKANVYPLSENTWDNPGFVKRFLGSYGVNSSIEPNLSIEDTEYLIRIMKLIDEDPEKAIKRIKFKIKFTKNSNATFDFLLGQLYLAGQQHKLAEASYINAIEKHPNFARAYKNLALSYMFLEQCGLARPLFLKVINLGKSDGTIYGMLAYCAMKASRFSDAVNLYRTARVHQPDDLDWKIGEVQAHIQLGSGNQAKEILNELLLEDPTNTDYLLLQTNLFIQVEDYTSAITNLDLLRRLESSNPDSMILLGDLYSQVKLYTLAKNAYLKSLSYHTNATNVPLPSFNRAILSFEYLSSSKNWRHASEYLKTLKRLYAINPQKTNTVAILEAQIAQFKKDYTGAINILTGVLKSDPINAKALILAAEVSMSLEAYEQSELYFNRASLDKNYRYEAFMGSGQLNIKRQRLEAAYNAFTKAYAIQPSEELSKNIAIIKNVLTPLN